MAKLDFTGCVASVRLHRTELAVPGSNVRMLEKAPALGADVVMLDLEDAVAPDDKPQAREQPRRRAARAGLVALLGVACGSTGSTPTGATATSSTWSSRPGEHVDAIVIPKVSGAGDVHLVATLLTQIEEAMGLERRIGLGRADRDRDRACSTSTRSPPPARTGWRR